MRLIFLLLATTLAADAAPNDPGGAAIDFLEKVRNRKLDLKPGGDTALAASTVEGKKQRIARRLERMARDLGSDPLEVAAVKEDENYAAVLVRKSGGLDPSRMQVFPVALIKRDSEWAVAPVPASFENADAGYVLALRRRLKILENWMLREQVVDLEKLREQSQQRLRETIRASLTEAELRGLTAEQVAQRFMRACADHDLPKVLGLIGGLAAELPSDWPLRLKAANQGLVVAPAAARPWRLLTAPEVPRILVHLEQETKSALISIACLDPSGAGAKSQTPRIELIHLELSKSSDGLWQIDPPAAFLQEASVDSDDDAEETLDADLLDLFPQKWSEAHPPKPEPSAEKIQETFVKTLRSGNLGALLRLSKLHGPPQPARESASKAAGLWWELHDPTTARHAMPLAFKPGKTNAAAVFQLLSAKDPDRFAPLLVYFERSAAGWFWTPEPAEATRREFAAWADTETARWTGEWKNQLMPDSAVAEIPAAAAPTEKEAEELVNQWLAATRQGDFEAALRLSARLDEADSQTITLRNLGFEIIGSRKGNAAVSGSYRGETWTAVGVTLEQDGHSTYPFYPVIQTANGPRILVESQLFAAGKRGRDFLNKTIFERLEKFTSVALASDLRKLYATYQAGLADSATKAAIR
ncbi:MAG: hypothetical protein WED15_06760 [Akkermansiaceae bacterium]